MTQQEPFNDVNKNGKWDAGEPYHDWNGDGVWTDETSRDARDPRRSTAPRPSTRPRTRR